jgi:hypothetical protein
MEDTTISSDDEEGKGVTDQLNEEHPPVSPLDNVENSTPNRDTDVTDEERALLEQSERPPGDDTQVVQKIALDGTDGEEPLNESGDPADLGSDLDVPGAELDDENEEIGEEDEENNPFSNSNSEEQ